MARSGPNESPRMIAPPQVGSLMLSAEEKLNQSLVVMVLRRQYVLALASVFITSMSVLMGMTLNDVLHTCLGGLFNPDDGGDCRGAAVQSGGAFVVALVMFVLSIRAIQWSFTEPSRPDASAVDAEARERAAEFSL